MAFDETHGLLDADLKQRVLDRCARELAATAEPLDIVLALANASVDIGALLAIWKPHIRPTGAIWVLTPKRSRPGYVGDGPLIAAGLQARLVDNKICSISGTTTAMRFVIRRSDRPRPASQS